MQLNVRVEVCVDALYVFVFCIQLGSDPDFLLFELPEDPQLSSEVLSSTGFGVYGVRLCQSETGNTSRKTMHVALL